MQRYDDSIISRSVGSGLQPMSGISVLVTDDSTGLPAALYSGNGTGSIANPLTTDDNGAFGFYAADGHYTLTFTGSRINTFTRKIILEDPADNPFATLAQLAAPTGATKIGYYRTSDGSTMTVASALDSVTAASDTTVRGTVLTGLSLLTNAAITASDTVLSAFGKLQKQFTDWFNAKDASGGYAGLTGFALNLWNTAGTFKSSLQNAATAVRTWTLPDNSGTLALTTDSAIQLLGQATVSSAVANIDFLTTFAASYDKYVIEVEGVIPSATDFLLLRVANAGTADTGNNYFYGATDNAAITATAFFSICGASVGSAGGGLTAHVEVANANSATKDKMITAAGFQMTATPDRRAILKAGGYSGANAVSGIRLYWQGGANFAAGTVRVYGIKNS